MSVLPQEKKANWVLEAKSGSHGRSNWSDFPLQLRKGILVCCVLMLGVANLVPLWSDDELNQFARYLQSQVGQDHVMSLLTKEASTVTPICQTAPWPVVLPSKIYHCGHDRHALLQLVYPEFASIPRTRLTRQSIRNATQHDVLVFGSCGLCPGFPKHPRLLEVLQKDFPGMVFHINGEAQNGDIWEQLATFQSSIPPQQQQSPQRPTNESNSSVPVVPAPPRRNFHIGYAADSNYSVRVLFASQTVAEASHEMQQWLFDPLQKPRNTGEAFLLYTASNCVPFREQAFQDIATAVSKISNVVHSNRSTVPHKGAMCGGDLAPLSPWKPKNAHGNWRRNYKSYRHYRFCLVLENKYQPGYITE